MKKVIILFAILTLSTLPQSSDVDTLYYLQDTTYFIPEYAIAAEVSNIHTKFIPPQFWQAYQIMEVHLLFRPSKIGDTIQSISFYKDTLQQLIYSQPINIILDSNNVFPNWLKIFVDNRIPITGEIEVPTWWGDLCEVEPVQESGNTFGFELESQSWIIFHDLPVKLIIKRIPLGIENSFQDDDDYGFKLEQNYPNPFNGGTKFWFDLPRRVPAAINVYDMLGNKITTLLDENKTAGSYKIEFNANERLASGIYFYQLIAGSFIQTKKMLLIR